VRYPAGNPTPFSAVYQSVLTGIEWGPTITSRFLQELGENGSYPTTLSIKFTVDGYDDDHTSPTFTWGRIVGAIGPYLAEEPKHFVNGRLLRTMPKSLMNYAPCYIDTGKKLLFVDFGNSLPTTTAGGPLQDIGPLQMAILPAKGDPILWAVNYMSRLQRNKCRYSASHSPPNNSHLPKALIAVIHQQWNSGCLSERRQAFLFAW
jgi:hypothetical protein